MFDSKDPLLAFGSDQVDDPPPEDIQFPQANRDMNVLSRWRKCNYVSFMDECDRDFRLALLAATPNTDQVLHRNLTQFATGEGDLGEIAAAIGFKLATSRVEDLPMSWLAFAAVNGSITASVSVITALDYLRDNANSLGKHKKARQLGKLALNWASHALARLRLHDAGRRNLLTREIQDLETRLKQEEKAKEAESPVKPQLSFGPPTKLVVPKIADTGGDSKDIRRIYEPLTRPLPLLGGQLNLNALKTVLDLRFPWMESVTSRIIGELRLGQMAGRGYAFIRPMLLVGPPGIGKSAYLKCLANCLGLPFDEIDASGSTDSRLLKGTARGWHGTQAGLPLQLMLRSRCANPIIMVDEIDKSGSSSHSGSIAEALLPYLEQVTAKSINDECLMSPCDLSAISWVLSANYLDQIPTPLRSRLTVIDTPLPQPEHFDGLAEDIINGIAKRHDCDPDMLPEVLPEIVEYLRLHFTRHRSIRLLTRAIEAVIEATVDMAPPRLTH